MKPIDEPVAPPEKAIVVDDDRRGAWIIYQLKLRGMSLADLARKYNKNRTGPRMCFKRPYPIWEKRIADELGLKPQDIFPERYDEYGIPNRPMGRPPKVCMLDGDRFA